MGIAEALLPVVATSALSLHKDTLLDADCVDELCLTVSPLIEAGDAPRIAAGAVEDSRRLALGHVLVADHTLMLQYRRRSLISMARLE